MRRFLKILGLGLAVLLLAVVTLPWWFGAAAGAVGRSKGLTFSRYERLGYGRFALHDVRVQRPNVHIAIDRVEADMPVRWAWRHWTNGARPVAATRWQVNVVSKTEGARPPRDPNAGAVRLRVQLLKLADQLERWLPQAETGAGAVRWERGEITVASASWAGRKLAAKELGYRGAIADVTLEFPRSAGEILVLAASPRQQWRAELRSRDRDLVGTATLWDQPATFSAAFADRGWMPLQATVRAQDWRLPASRVKLGEAYATVSGGAELDWRDGGFRAVINLAGEPIEGKKAPPLVTNIRAHGDAKTITIEAVSAELPGIVARLSAPVVLDWQGHLLNGGSRFTLEADLAKQPWFKASGRVFGDARVVSVDGVVPRVDGVLTGRDIDVAGWIAPAISADASLAWPQLQVRNAVVTLVGDDKVTARGAWDFKSKQFAAVELSATVNQPSVDRWLPAGLAFTTLTVSAKAHGPLATLEHEGRAQIIGAEWRRLRRTDATFNWRGTGTQAEISDGIASAGASRLSFAGRVGKNGLQLAALQLVQDGVERLTLSAPATIRWAPVRQSSPLRLVGKNAEVALSGIWGESGEFEVKVRHLPAAWLADFIEFPGPSWVVSTLEGRGKWDRGPMQFNVLGDFEIALGRDRSATIKMMARDKAGGIQIESLEVSEGTVPIASVTGQLPVTLHPGGARFIQSGGDRALNLTATTSANPEFWNQITALTGFDLKNPEVNVRLAGTWNRPRGEFQARAARIAPVPGRANGRMFPAIEALELRGTADGRDLVIEDFSMRVDGQNVTATGKLPLALEQLHEIRRDPIAFVRREGTLQVRVPDADMAALAHYLPAYLAPKGRLQADVAVKPGGDLIGWVRVLDATSRPLGPLGVLQDVNADVHFSGRKAELRGVNAKAGGQPVSLTGSAILPREGAPKFDLSLKGANLPFVRQAGLILRGDVDLKLTTDPDGIPRISGSARLRDSIFLSDVRSLIPSGGGSAPARRPPYFAVESEPLSGWRLAVDVHGDDFLRMRTTFFNGVISARFRLGGTFGDPRAIGEAVIDSGQVLLPFADFQVFQGSVRLTQADPYEPQIHVTGESRRFGYDIRMEVTGTATSPIVTFSSSPPLEAEQVLLMVMTGETPKDEVAYTTGRRFAALGTYLGQSLLNRLGGDASGAERLTITSGEKVSRQGRETYDIEYEVNDRLTAVGEYDEFDEYNVGLKWKIFSQKKPAVEATAKHRDESR